mgnify:CR=1 FL=1
MHNFFCVINQRDRSVARALSYTFLFVIGTRIVLPYFLGLYQNVMFFFEDYKFDVLFARLKLVVCLL